MRWSKTFIPTLKEIPKEAEAISHILMLRAGLIRKLTSGTYAYLPLGWKVLYKITQIVREEMNRAGAQEVLMPAMQPKELWEQTGRYASLKGDILITYQDRHGKEIVFGPTHEEIITYLVSGEIRSYKQLPQIIYQIQTKFRDEPRARFGIIRTAEFIMKDAYSFDADWEGLEKSYEKMYTAYQRIFERCGLNFIAVEADPGMMGGNVSHEFMAPTENGEDKIVVCEDCQYAASLEVAECALPTGNKSQTIDTKVLHPMQEVETPGVSTVEKVSQFLKVSPQELVKTIILLANGKEIAVLLRGDYELNLVKLARYLKTENLILADEKTIMQVTGGPLGFSGPVGIKGIRLLADYSLKGMFNFVTGANKRDKHLVNVNLGRDFSVEEFGDFRYFTAQDKCPRCGGRASLKTALEIGHIFKLGTKYSSALKANFSDSDGKEKPLIMGCYGIGINRIMAAFIEQNHDKEGIVWNKSLSPFEILILPTHPHDSLIKEIAEELYNRLREKEIDCLLDDREVSPGVKFKDADLLGIPLRLVVGQNFLKKGLLELRLRRSGETSSFTPAEAIEKILDKIKNLV
ncbi:MAG: proline--tRNA ligase [Candidatus Omnitrophica bacterium]|nr:proline--tRNA ligase [Candidatus Omnitrophota bacterium]